MSMLPDPDPNKVMPRLSRSETARQSISTVIKIIVIAAICVVGFVTFIVIIKVSSSLFIREAGPIAAGLVSAAVLGGWFIYRKYRKGRSR